MIGSLLRILAALARSLAAIRRRETVMHRILPISCAAVLIWPFVNGITLAAVYSFTRLGDFPGGIFDSWASDVSHNGAVVVGSSEGENGREAYRWTSADGMMGLGDLPGGDTHSSTLAVSGDGSTVVGHSESAMTGEAFRWTSTEGMVGLGFLPGRTFASLAASVSADGTVIVGRSLTSPSPISGEAFYWTQAQGMVGLGDLPGGIFNSAAWDTSADGSVIVGDSNSDSGDELFRWTSAGGMVGLGKLRKLPRVFGGPTGAYGVSEDGAVVVGSSGGEPFRWTSETGMVSLGFLPGPVHSTEAVDVSADGSVIVGSSPAAEDGAFIWKPELGMMRLRDVLIRGGVTGLENWSLEWANAVSADGITIVGYGINPLGAQEAYIATIPEPSSLALTAIVLLTAGGCALSRVGR